MINKNSSVKLDIGSGIVVRTAKASYALNGASADDLTAAKEWVSLFMHDAVLSSAIVVHRRATSSSRWKVSSLGKSA